MNRRGGAAGWSSRWPSAPRSALAPAAHAGRAGHLDALHDGHPTTVFQPALARDSAGTLQRRVRLRARRRGARPARAAHPPVRERSTAARPYSTASSRSATRPVPRRGRRAARPGRAVSGHDGRGGPAGRCSARPRPRAAAHGALQSRPSPRRRGGSGSAPATWPRCSRPAARRSCLSSRAPASAWSPIPASTRSVPPVVLPDQFAGCCIGQAQVVRDTRSGATVADHQSVVAGNNSVFAQALDPATAHHPRRPSRCPGWAPRRRRLRRSGPRPHRRRRPRAPAAGSTSPCRAVSRPRTGARRSASAAGAAHARLAAVATPLAAAMVATPDSRVWVAWTDEGDGSARVMLRQSNPGGDPVRPGEFVVAGPAPGRIDEPRRLTSQALRLDLRGLRSGASRHGAYPRRCCPRSS